LVLIRGNDLLMFIVRAGFDRGLLRGFHDLRRLVRSDRQENSLSRPDAEQEHPEEEAKTDDDQTKHPPPAKFYTKSLASASGRRLFWSPKQSHGPLLLSMLSYLNIVNVKNRTTVMGYF
jgi:hypothetical protein